MSFLGVVSKQALYAQSHALWHTCGRLRGLSVHCAQFFISSAPLNYCISGSLFLFNGSFKLVVQQDCCKIAVWHGISLSQSYRINTCTLTEMY